MTHPTKEKIRDWFHNEVAQHRPPQSPAEIRQQLGWGLIEAERYERLRHESDSEGGATD